MEYKYRDMENLIKELPLQLRKGLELKPIGKLNDKLSDIKEIFIAGMGGSGIVGNLIEMFSRIPVHVIKDYDFTKSAGEKTLIILVSYSGETEETLSVLEKVPSDAYLLLVSSGGKLIDYAQKNNIPHILLKKGYAPRCALGWMFSSLFSFLAPFLKFKNKELINTANFLQRKTEKFLSINGLPFKISERIYKRFLFIYTTKEYFAPALRWKTQINENSKAFVHIELFPEMNHNEIVGLTMPKEFLEETWAIFIRGEDQHPRNKIRIEETYRLLDGVFMGQDIIDAEGANFLERIFYLIYFGDWVSLHLSRFYKVDPFEIQRIERLKELMKKR